jgi:mono/diheme cytochrome c family protein
MGKFVFGVIIGLAVSAVGGYVYVHYGFVNLQADRGAGMVERVYMQGAMDRSVERHAPRVRNPIEPTDANLVEGIRLYKANCAGCHGGPDKPVSELGLGFSPQVPQFAKDTPDMPDYQNYWIIRHGVKMTGMPAWEKVLSEADTWKIVTFLGKMEDLDRLSPEVRQAWKSGGQTELGAQQNPSVPPTPQPAPTEPEHHHHHHE